MKKLNAKQKGFEDEQNDIKKDTNCIDLDIIKDKNCQDPLC